MQVLQADAPILVVTVLLILLLAALLLTRTVTITDTYVQWILSMIVSFWFLYSGFKWQAPVPPSTTPPPATPPTVPSTGSEHV